MYIEKIMLKNFRRYDETIISFKDGINIIYGNNGKGKTTILESIDVLTTTKSYKDRSNLSLIKNNEDYFFIKGKIIYKNNINKILEIGFNKNKIKKMKINSQEVNKVVDYIGELLNILITNEDINIIKNTPFDKRKFLDLTLSLVNKEYCKHLIRYNKILEERNKILKENSNISVLESWDVLLSQSTSYILETRLDFINFINQHIQNYFDFIYSSKDYSIKINYLTDFENTSQDYVYQKIRNNINKDINKQFTTIGIHKDTFDILFNNNNIKNYASYGQQKIVAIILKLLAAKLFEEKTSEKPIILLDDLFSELDRDKQINILKLLKNKKYQTIITTTEIEHFNNIFDDINFIQC